MKLIIIFIVSLSLVRCDSPMNNRVEENNSTLSQAQKISFTQGALVAEFKWIAGPVGNITFNNILLVILRDAQGRLANLPENQTLEFYSTMPSMGHPLEDPGYFEPISEGMYLNKTIKYNMPGDWKNELWILDADFNIKDKLEWDDFF